MAGRNDVSGKTAVSNSRFPPASLPSVAGAGIDTISLAWRPADDRVWRRLAASITSGQLYDSDLLPEAGSTQHAAEVFPAGRGSGMLRHPLHGVRWLFYPRHRLLVCEGRLRALVSGSSEAEGLGTLDELVLGEQLAAFAIEEVGVPLFSLGEPAVVRRLDLAVDLEFADAEAGLSLLRDLLEVRAGRLKTNAYLFDGRVETVAWLTRKEKRRVFRVYDRGVAAGTRQPGTLIRLEAQRRIPKDRQAPVAELLPRDLAQHWEDPLKPVLRSLESATAFAQVRARETFALAATAWNVQTSATVPLPFSS